jgi:hypothetical protein
MPDERTALFSNQLVVVLALLPERRIVTRFIWTARTLALCLFFLVDAAARPAIGQTPEPPPDKAATANASPVVVAQAADDDAALDPAEPDFTLVNIPTTLRLPLHKGNFHLTHRFAGNLRQGSFGEQANNLFGLDQGAMIGFEYRHGIARHVQLVAYRSSFDKTIQLSGKYDAIHQNAVNPVSVSGLVSVEGPNNFQERFAPALGVVVSRTIQQRLAVYASPIWVHNSAAAIGVDRETLMVGLGGRVRIGSSTYVVGEVTPRAAGYAPGTAEYGFGFEKRYGGHVFLLTFANTFGTTWGQLARGGSTENLSLGFNMTRKFF